MVRLLGRIRAISAIGARWSPVRAAAEERRFAGPILSCTRMGQIDWPCVRGGGRAPCNELSRSWAPFGGERGGKEATGMETL